MSKTPFMQLWVADFLGDTMHLSQEEVGSYILLLMTMWANGGALPSDQKRLKRIARGQITEAVMEFFDTDQEGIFQKRLRSELQKAELKHEARRVAGKMGGEAKASKSSSNATAKPYHLPESEPEPEPYSKEPPIVPQGGRGMNGVKKSQAHPECQTAVKNYNTAADQLGLSKARLPLTAERERKLSARLKEHGLSGWNDALRALCEQPFCLGEGGRGWRANLDFLLQPGSLNKVIDRAYVGLEGSEDG